MQDVRIADPAGHLGEQQIVPNALLPKLRGSDSYPDGTVSQRTRQPSLDPQRQLTGKPSDRCGSI
jgi:hypothetical protein